MVPTRGRSTAIELSGPLPFPKAHLARLSQRSGMTPERYAPQRSTRGPQYVTCVSKSVMTPCRSRSVPNCPIRIGTCEREWCELRTAVTRIRASAVASDPLTLITSKRNAALYGGLLKYVRVDSRPLPDR